MAKSLAEQIGGKCIHFNGLINDACDAGVVYATVEGERVPYRKGLPCFRDGNGTGHCDKCHFPTDEEVAAEVAEMERSFENTKRARAAIVAHISQTGEQAGVCVCPVCSGRLHYRRARCNGHIHARCETEECVAWME